MFYYVRLPVAFYYSIFVIEYFTSGLHEEQYADMKFREYVHNSFLFRQTKTMKIVVILKLHLCWWFFFTAQFKVDFQIYEKCPTLYYNNTNCHVCMSDCVTLLVYIYCSKRGRNHVSHIITGGINYLSIRWCDTCFVQY